MDCDSVIRRDRRRRGFFPEVASPNNRPVAPDPEIQLVPPQPCGSDGGHAYGEIRQCQNDGPVGQIFHGLYTGCYNGNAPLSVVVEPDDPGGRRIFIVIFSLRDKDAGEDTIDVVGTKSLAPAVEICDGDVVGLSVLANERLRKALSIIESAALCVYAGFGGAIGHAAIHAAVSRYWSGGKDLAEPDRRVLVVFHHERDCDIGIATEVTQQDPNRPHDLLGMQTGHAGRLAAHELDVRVCVDVAKPVLIVGPLL